MWSWLVATILLNIALYIVIRLVKGVLRVFGVIAPARERISYVPFEEGPNDEYLLPGTKTRDSFEETERQRSELRDSLPSFWPEEYDPRTREDLARRIAVSSGEARSSLIAPTTDQIMVAVETIKEMILSQMEAGYLVPESVSARKFTVTFQRFLFDELYDLGSVLISLDVTPTSSDEDLKAGKYEAMFAVRFAGAPVEGGMVGMEFLPNPKAIYEAGEESSHSNCLE